MQKTLLKRNGTICYAFGIPKEKIDCLRKVMAIDLEDKTLTDYGKDSAKRDKDFFDKLGHFSTEENVDVEFFYSITVLSAAQ